MRLLSFVPCGCRAGPIDDAPPAAAAAADIHSGDGGAAARRRRRRQRRATSLGGSPQWRPALGDIYEEYTGGTTTEARKTTGVVPVRGKTMAASRVLPRAHSDDHRRIETASSMPAFAPTAFLF